MAKKNVKVRDLKPNKDAKGGGRGPVGPGGTSGVHPSGPGGTSGVHPSGPGGTSGVHPHGPGTGI